MTAAKAGALGIRSSSSTDHRIEAVRPHRTLATAIEPRRSHTSPARLPGRAWPRLGFGGLMPDPARLHDATAVSSQLDNAFLAASAPLGDPSAALFHHLLGFFSCSASTGRTSSSVRGQWDRPPPITWPAGESRFSSSSSSRWATTGAAHTAWRESPATLMPIRSMPGSCPPRSRLGESSRPTQANRSISAPAASRSARPQSTT